MASVHLDGWQSSNSNQENQAHYSFYEILTLANKYLQKESAVSLQIAE